MSLFEEQQRRLAYLDAMGIQVWQARENYFPTVNVVEDVVAPTIPLGDEAEREHTNPVVEVQPQSVPVADMPVQYSSGVPDVASDDSDVPDFGMPPLDAYSPADMPPEEFDESKYDDLPVVAQRPLSWEELQEKIKTCSSCELHCQRTQAVFGSGDANADVMFISEAPGVDEDALGLPLVGESGHLLDLILNSIDIRRKDVYFTNIVKCHPPGNRDLHVDELAACADYLYRQIELVTPRIIVAVGRVSSQKLLETKQNLAELRLSQHTYGADNIPIFVTYHPAYLLRSPQDKRKSWDDMLKIRDCLKSLPELSSQKSES